MTPLKLLKQAVSIFEELECTYCLVGGHAASLYRSHPRLTNDVDFAVTTKPASRARRIAEQVIERLGLKPMVGFIPPSPKERRRKSVCMITATPAKNELNGLIDILLPELPWVAPAIGRAQYNKLNLGFAIVPVITPEDLIVAKCYALNNAPDRFQDLDDLKDLFQSVRDIDVDYIRRHLGELKLSVPDAVQKYAPARLL